MDRFEWNGLRTGTSVVAHGRGDFHLADGKVVAIVARPRRNGVGVRLASGVIVWPTPGELHAVPRVDDSDQCWRCSFRRTSVAWSSGPAAPDTSPPQGPAR